MSNFLAIATVTAALQQILQGPVKNAVGGATVGFNRPNGSAAAGGAEVDVYLYEVTPNAAYRNQDLPTRRSDGSLVQKPQAALDLHYLFTFQGDDSKLEPQRMLGAVVTTLQSQPLLSTQNIQAAATHFGFLAGSGLDTQVERVKFTPSSLTLDEFTKLWSAFFQVEYRLSAAYQASVVLIESDDAPQEGPPVQSRNVYALPFRMPTVTRVISQAGANQPIVATSTLVVQGARLLAPLTLVQTGNLTTTPASVTDSAIILPVPAGLAAGIQGLKVLQQLLLGTPPQPHSGFESNIVPFILHPVISSPSATASLVSLTVNPPAQQGQRATLLLNEATSPPPSTPAAYSFSLPPLTGAASTLNFAISGVQGGGTRYFVRVSVDGAESPLDLDAGSATFGPTVTIP